MAGKDRTYAELRDEFPAIRDRAKELIEKAKSTGLEVPSSLEDELRAAEFQRNNALNGRTIKEAREEVLNAIERVDQVLSKVLRFFLAKPFQDACAARKFFEGYDDFAFEYIQNYGVHNDNFCKIRELIEGDEKLCEKQARSCMECLNRFLRDFERGKPGLAAAITRKEEEKKEAKERFRISTKLTCVVIIIGVATLLATIIFGIIGLKGCSDSSQQTSQPEATASATEP